MHHIYSRRIVIAISLFFAVLALLFGPLVVSLRTQLAPAGSIVEAACDCEEPGDSASITLPDGEATFNNFCSSCHQAQSISDKLKESLDADAESKAQLGKLIGPPAHGGVSPAEALAVVILLRTMAGLPSNYPEGAPTPAAAATAAAVAPTPTQIIWMGLRPEAYEQVFNHYCGTCHQAEKFAEGLMAVPDPDRRSRRALTYLLGPPIHQNLPTEAIKPAVDHIRRLAGLDPIR